MRIAHLSLTDLRSYPRLEVEFGAGPQILWGENAAGKTNLIEALVTLALGRSHRAGSDLELIAWGRPFARILGTVRRDGGAGAEIELVVAREPARGGRKRLRVNGVSRRASGLAETFRIVLFAPEHMLLVTGAPALRRAEIDELGAQRSPGHHRALATYGRALQQRNGLLRAIREGTAQRAELAFWDRAIAEEGGAIVEARLALLADLAGGLAAAYTEIAPGEGRLALRYETNAPPDAALGESPRDALRRRLAETAEKEIWNGATLVGPHRDDIVFELDGRALPEFASRGQQRAAILALKLAELELLAALNGSPPLLLLDDVFSELDPLRRAHLVRRILALPQAFLTTTTLAELDRELIGHATRWRVTPGRVESDAGSPP